MGIDDIKAFYHAGAELSRLYLAGQVVWEKAVLRLPHDEDFVRGKKKGEWHYVGKHDAIGIPDTIQGERITSIKKMFSLRGTHVRKVSCGRHITNMAAAFVGNKARYLDLTELSTGYVVDMSGMFLNARSGTIDLRYADTRRVRTMQAMFANCKAHTLNLGMFDTSKVLDMYAMFEGCTAKTVYVRNAEEKARMEATSNCPKTINFVAGNDR